MNCSPLGPLFLGFSRSWLPFPSPRDLPDHAGIQPRSLRSPALAGNFFPLAPPAHEFE